MKKVKSLKITGKSGKTYSWVTDKTAEEVLEIIHFGETPYISNKEKTIFVKVSEIEGIEIV